jgi:hypothetical protein
MLNRYFVAFANWNKQPGSGQMMGDTEVEDFRNLDTSQLEHFQRHPELAVKEALRHL